MQKHPVKWKIGDRVRGKDHNLRGVITALLNDGRIMVLDDESGMELPENPNAFVPEIISAISAHIRPKEGLSTVTKKGGEHYTIDLHWEKLPSGFRKEEKGRLYCQLEYLRNMLGSNTLCRSVTIITGRGQGILLKEVKKLLKSNKRVKAIQEGGKTAFEGADRLEVEFV